MTPNTKPTGRLRKWRVLAVTRSQASSIATIQSLGQGCQQAGGSEAELGATEEWWEEPGQSWQPEDETRGPMSQMLSTGRECGEGSAQTLIVHTGNLRLRGVRARPSVAEQGKD